VRASQKPQEKKGKTINLTVDEKIIIKKKNEIPAKRSNRKNW
jgi:hypothetical protein